ncbi:MAG: hypothetical protein AB3N13_13075 [Arenibacterium sp.]
MRKKPKLIEHYMRIGTDEFGRYILLRLGPKPGYFVQTEGGDVRPVPTPLKKRIHERRGKAMRTPIPRQTDRPNTLKSNADELPQRKAEPWEF